MTSDAPTVDVVIPVCNEERDLEHSVRRVSAYLRENCPFDVRITIADNASTDGTWAIATRLRDELAEVEATHLDTKGRGGALKHAWQASGAQVLAYMDVDLSTGLDAFLPLVEPLLAGDADVAIATRRSRSSRVTRGLRRELISRSYNALLRLTLHVGFTDAQCGFKAIRADHARALLPRVADDGWFFDTELLVLAERDGLRIHEVAVDWVERADSRVAIAPTAAADLRGIVRLARGRESLPFVGLIVATAALYLYGLGRNGYGNSFYAAAVQAGSSSWKAFFFGSFDASSFITVDKPPGSLWVMELSCRIFGFGSWSMIVPQALEGVAAVALLYATVRRVHGAAPALISGTALAVTPAAALVFRFNNPDALLVLTMVAGAYATTRALERGSTGWLIAAGAVTGLGFLTKMSQALLVVPAFALAYLVAAPTPLRRRLRQLLAAGGALVAAAGWWVAIVALVPASDRPFIGGTSGNSILELIVGYNGLGRLTGNEAGGGGAAEAGPAFGGSPGAFRLFNDELGGQVGWLLPAALLALVYGLWTARRASRTDPARAALLLWGGWLVAGGLVYSFAGGILHPYYTSTLAPAIAALAGTGAVALWSERERASSRALLALMLAATGVWAHVLLDRTPGWQPWLRVAVLAGGVAVAGLVAAAGHRLGRLSPALAWACLGVALAAPFGSTLATASTVQQGPAVTAGPVASEGSSDGAPAIGPAVVDLLKAETGSAAWGAAALSWQAAAAAQLGSRVPVMAIGGFSGSDPTPTLARFQALVASGRIHYFIVSGGYAAFGSVGARAIWPWVRARFPAQTVDGSTVYDLTAAPTG